MKSISTAAFAAAMVAGATGLAFAPPAFAKKKEEAPAGPQYTQAVAVAANKAKTALLAKDMATAETAVGEAEAVAHVDVRGVVPGQALARSAREDEHLAGAVQTV